jgi:hypothetical protein
MVYIPTLEYDVEMKAITFASEVKLLVEYRVSFNCEKIQIPGKSVI